jgi:shikimate 5-dehydrogenase
MSHFAKLFTLGTHQVVAYKDFQTNQDGVDTHQIVCLVGAGGGAQQVAYGYKEEDKRDAKFEEFNERGAQITLDMVLQSFDE